jgi:hypothetical protein
MFRSVAMAEEFRSNHLLQKLRPVWEANPHRVTPTTAAGDDNALFLKCFQNGEAQVTGNGTP